MCPVSIRSWFALGMASLAAMNTATAQTATAPAGGDLPAVRLVKAFPELQFDRPVFLAAPPNDPERFFLIEQAGRMLVFDNRKEADKTEVILDVRDRIMSHANGGFNEEGLLAFAFHPTFVENRAIYVYYSADKPRRGVISRFRVAKDDPPLLVPESEEVILEVLQPYLNHNGCTLLFGPDGFLYASFGDGGAGNDPQGHGQNLATLLGSIIRIDVDRQEGGLRYAIPKDNPFVKRVGARPEIFAYGLRNVWRMSFDRATGELWAGDIGQDKWEEIDLIKSGGNYGWNITEGFHLFKGGRSEDPLQEPVIEYGRHLGWSVTGGYVYRGDRIKSLVGAYVYADYVSGRLWALRFEPNHVTAHKELIDTELAIASFSEGPDGEIYVLAFDGYVYILEELRKSEPRP
jgi:glucose/arabinose dehydrogenase